MAETATADQVLAFRLDRSGLSNRRARGLAEAAACPASDFARDAALLALGARTEGLTRERYAEAIDAGEIVVAHAIRGAIHAMAPEDFALWGRALLGRDDDELLAQMGRQMKREAAQKGFSAREALDEVAEAIAAALKGGRALDRNELHEELRRRVRDELLPWCKGCRSHHVAPMLWRYGTVRAGARLDSERRYVAGRPGRAPRASEAVRRFLGHYGPANVGDFAEWAGLARPHARRLWDEVAGELAEVGVDGAEGWLLRKDAGALRSAPKAEGIRLIPPGDPYLQKPNRSLIAPDPQLRKRLFRPVASPGAVLADGRLAGLWRARAKGRKLEVAVEIEGARRLPRRELERAAERVAELRGAAEAVLTTA